MHTQIHHYSNRVLLVLEYSSKVQRYLTWELSSILLLYVPTDYKLALLYSVVYPSIGSLHSTEVL
jgi:hypothetical protein